MLSIVGGGIQRLSATVYIAVSFFPLPLCFFFILFLFLSARPVLGVLRFVSHWILEKFLVRRWLLSCKKTFFWTVSILLCAKRRLVVGMLWLSRGGLECLRELSLVYVRWCFGKMA